MDSVFLLIIDSSICTLNMFRSISTFVKIIVRLKDCIILVNMRIKLYQRDPYYVGAKLGLLL